MRPSFGSNSWPWTTGSFMETSATRMLVRNRLLAWRLRPQPNQGLVAALEGHWRPSLHKNRCADKNLATVGGSLLSCCAAIVALSTSDLRAHTLCCDWLAHRTARWEARSCPNGPKSMRLFTRSGWSLIGLWRRRFTAARRRT
jgi:hypothetical protein